MQPYRCPEHIIVLGNIKTQALTIQTDSQSAVPTVYPEMLADMYEPGMTIPELSEKVIDFTNHYAMHAPDINMLMKKDYMLENSRLAICNESWNEEMLKTVVHQHVEGTDLAIYPTVSIGDSGSVKVTYDLLEHCGISEDEIFESAKSNSKSQYTVRPMQEVMAELTGSDPEEMPPMDMVVLSNTGSYNGATAITDMDSLDKACGIVGSKNIVIIPSSVHEILVVPADMVTAEELSTMIGDVNESLVQNTERLSDHPYAYDGHSLSMDHHLQLVSVILRVEFFRQHNRYNIVHLHITPNSNLLDRKILTPDIFLINFVISCALDIIVISIAPVHRTYGKSAHKIHIGLVSHIFCSFQML